jgi:hypothetical protein
MPWGREVCLFIGKQQSDNLYLVYSKLKSVSEVIKIGHVVLIWLILNMISASFTLLYTDETYYRLFAQQLSFGYFDHPPMIALFIRLGSIISNNETGVRLLSVMSVAIALYFIYRLSGVQNPVLFMAAIFSVFAINLLGFMALPDAPLLLFTVLFFVAYKRFLIKESAKNVIFLSFVMAALLYSKYHGILVILFTITSNLKLLKSPKFWLGATIGVLLFVPHLLWQVNNSFVTFSYQLLDRSASHYQFSVTLEYIIGQLLFYGPVTTLFMYIALIKNKGYNQFERALIWNMLGITIFFLISTLKGRVEVNWTLPVLCPLLIIFMKYSDIRPVFRKRFYYCSVPVIVLILLFRIQMIYPALNLSISRIDELRNQKEFVGEVVSKSHGLPIVACTYQKAGIISYYSNTFVPSINLYGRRNQFNLWHSEDSLRLRKVAYINNYLKDGENIQNPYYRDYKVSIIDSLPVMSDIIISVEPIKSRVRINQGFSIKVLLDAGKTYNNYKDAGGYNTRLHAELWSGDSLLKEQACLIPLDILLNIYDGVYIFRFVSPAERGTYKIKVALKTSELGTWSTGKIIGLTVL